MYRNRKEFAEISSEFSFHFTVHTGCRYAGEKPFSEPETQALKRMVEEREFKIALNFHSYGTMLTYPYNYAITVGKILEEECPYHSMVTSC